MTLEKINDRIWDYHSLLKKTGRESPCIVKKLVLLPMLYDMLHGELSVYGDTASRSVVDKRIDAIFGL